MAQKKKYRVAVVGGAGAWGRYYLRAYAGHPDCQIIALVDRARDRRQAFADRYGIRAVFDDVEDLLSREVPDIVSVILPVGVSHRIVAACAGAGVRAISCEKPIAVRLEEADRMVALARRHGAALGCGTAYWEVPHLLDIAGWVRAGHIGRLTGAAIPAGLPREVSGGGCVQLTQMRLLTGMEVEWVEGWVLPPQDWLEGWDLPEGHSAGTGSDDTLYLDCPAYGRLGLSGGIVCQIPPPREERTAGRVSLTGENGRVWVASPESVLIQGADETSTPVYPDFLKAPVPEDMFVPVIERLMRAVDSGREADCSGHDYRQALEIAIALILSSRRGHERIRLPLEDRSHGIVPRPYRLCGGDAVGYERSGHRIPSAAL